MRFSKWLLGISFLADIAFSQTLVFKNRGKIEASLSFKELSAKVAPEEIEVWEAHEFRDRKYKVFDTQKVLNAVYGPRWRETEEVLFTCVDGYQPSVSVSKLKANKSYLAFDATPKFTLINKFQNNELVDLGPFYLVWENKINKVIKEEGAIDWPYQVASIDLIRFADKFANTAPPSGSSAEVQRGFLSFRKTCMKCHTVNGEGGSKGVELNYPVSVTEYWKKEWLEKWILDPTSIRFDSKMPGLKMMDTNASATLKDLMAYFEIMAKTKRPPKAH